MKKLFILGLITMLSFSLTSCDKEDPSKDVNNAIAKLSYFNETFEKLFEDGKISKEGGDESEFKQLRQISSEYYELINKINDKVAEENERILKKKKIDNYNEGYKKALKEKQSEIDAAVALFEANMEKLKASQE